MCNFKVFFDYLHDSMEMVAACATIFIGYSAKKLADEKEKERKQADRDNKLICKIKNDLFLASNLEELKTILTEILSNDLIYKIHSELDHTVTKLFVQSTDNAKSSTFLDFYRDIIIKGELNDDQAKSLKRYLTIREKDFT